MVFLTLKSRFYAEDKGFFFLNNLAVCWIFSGEYYLKISSWHNKSLISVMFRV
uniref:Uncharacterized protein n=1 Tax=Anguilla anguilla TaxID=7936 RepID=A0A0E9WMU3_ANGAN